MRVVSNALERWEDLVCFANGRPPRYVGMRDPEHPCTEFDGRGYRGTGRCTSDGHYMCCSGGIPRSPGPARGCTHD